MQKRDAISSSEFLQVKKFIPEYQRDFVWSPQDINVFIKDVYDAFEDKSEKNDYFIGSMVFQSTDKNNEFLIIDGQQRITTIHLILCIGTYILDQRNAHKNEKERLNVLYINAPDNKQFLQGENSLNKILLDIHENGTQNIEPKTKNIPIRSIWNATKEIFSFFEIFENTKTGNEKLVRFLHFIPEQVKFSYTTSSNEQDSLTVFERLNSSGKILSELEILKGLLFKNTDEWSELKDKWDEFKKKVNTSEIKTDKIFLRHFVSIYYKKIVMEEQFHSNGLIKTSDIIKMVKSKSVLTSEPLQTIEYLISYIDNLINLQNGKDIFGNESDVVKNIIEITNSKAHNLFLCQAKDPVVFKTAAFISQVQTTINKVLGHYTGTTEQRFASWSKMIFEGYRNGSSPELISKELAQDSLKEFVLDWSKVENKFNELRYDIGNNCEIILKLVEIYINKQNKNLLSDGLKSDVFDKSSLDHIEPRNSSNFEEFGGHFIGNLALLGISPNSAVQDKPIEHLEKQSAYRDSQFYTTMYLIDSKKSHGGSEGKMRKTFTRKSFDKKEWSFEETENRKNLLKKYLRKFLFEELENIES